EYVDLVLRFAEPETDVGVLQSLHQQARTALTQYAAPEWRPVGGRLLAAGARSALHEAVAGSDHQLAWARFFASVAATEADLSLLHGLLSGPDAVDGLDVDQDLRWSVLERLAAHGVANEQTLRAELGRDDTASGARQLARCLAARPDPRAKAEAWCRVVESGELPNAMVDAVVAGFNQADQRDLLAPYAPKYFAVLKAVWSQRSIEAAMRIVRGFFPALQTSQETLDATDGWLARASAPPALRRLVLEARDDLARTLHAQERDAGAAEPD
ncbi:MAG TPA: ERAP1-like C-terminal domain-containing protein, partial [Nocardioidaceae bacterium]|nr:ERAP1-like C-terminal domain-containing protein [Nocardioidaceae bacterium]